MMGRTWRSLTEGRNHEDFKDLLGRLVNAITDDLHIPCRGAGETTWKRRRVKRGLEADLSYYFRAQDVEVRTSAGPQSQVEKDIAAYPNPDLAIEVDISPPEVDRPSIYAALKVAEVWRFDGESLTIEQLGPDGKYVPADSIRFLPIRPAEVVHWVVEENTDDLADWRARLRVWIQAELAPRRNPAADGSTGAALALVPASKRGR